MYFSVKLGFQCNVYQDSDYSEKQLRESTGLQDMRREAKNKRLILPKASLVTKICTLLQEPLCIIIGNIYFQTVNLVCFL